MIKEIAKMERFDFMNTYLEISCNLADLKIWHFGNSLAVQWLGLCTLTAEDPGSTPAWGTKIP